MPAFMSTNAHNAHCLSRSGTNRVSAGVSKEQIYNLRQIPPKCAKIATLLRPECAWQPAGRYENESHCVRLRCAKDVTVRPPTRGRIWNSQTTRVDATPKALDRGRDGVPLGLIKIRCQRFDWAAAIEEGLPCPSTGPLPELRTLRG